MKSQSTKDRFIELRAEGMSYDKIAKELSIAKSTLIEWSRESEHVIANMRAVHMESLQERYKINKQARIEQLGMINEKIREEISKRDLKDIPTDKLITLFSTSLKQMKEEEESIKFRVVEEFRLSDIQTATEWEG
jgi:transposase